MSLKSKITALKICGNCVFASRNLNSQEILSLRNKFPMRQRSFPYLVLLKRYAKPLRDVKVFCRREKVTVSLLDEACAFWKNHS